MPKSDTWPGGIGLETMTGMDSAGSCDSVVSANSGFSDDSLEHLSAEEKACLMFLEETIDSLDTEEDSGLSNDEPDQLPCPGTVATKLADLSASMCKSKLNGPVKPLLAEPIKENVVTTPMQSYMVPTPLVLASSPPCSVPSAKLVSPPDKNLYSKPQVTLSGNKSSDKNNQKPAGPPVPLEVSVVVPPPTKPRDYSFRPAEGLLPRGPLSYDALVHLRKSASTKKTPLCPTVDHTIELDKNLPATAEGQNLRKPPTSDRSNSEASRSKAGPPAVPPKPKNILASISVKTQNDASKPSDLSCSVNHSPDPKVVRLEALQKLGLLKDQDPDNETAAPRSTPGSHSSVDPLARLTRGPPNVNPSRSPSFCFSQVPTEPKNRSLQSSASFHHCTRHGQQHAAVSSSAQSNGFKAASLQRSATLDDHRKSENRAEPQRMAAVGTVKTSTAQSVPHKSSNAVAYTVMVVPGMGADRKEALRKLGLLKQ